MLQRNPLSPRTKEIYDFISDYYKIHDRSPTLTLIGNQFGVTKVAIWYHVNKLVLHGWVMREHRARHGIMPTDVLEREAAKLAQLDG